MQVLMLAIVMVIAGAAAFVIGPSVAGALNRGKASLIGIGLMLGGAGLAAVNAVVIVDVGEVGVKHFLGNVTETPLGQGIHFVRAKRRPGRHRHQVDQRHLFARPGGERVRNGGGDPG